MRRALPSLYLRAAAGGDGLRQALESGADAVVITISERESDFLPSASRGGAGPLLFIELGPPDAPGADAALDRSMRLRPDGLLLAGCRGLRAVEHLSAKLAVREAEAGVVEGTVVILAQVNSAAGVVALPSLAGGAPRLAGLCCDLDRLRQALGCENGAWALQSASATLVTVATAAGRPAITGWSCGSPLPQGEGDEAKPSGGSRTPVEEGLPPPPPFGRSPSPLSGGDAAAHVRDNNQKGEENRLLRLARQGFRGAILSSPEEVTLAREVFGLVSPDASA